MSTLGGKMAYEYKLEQMMRRTKGRRTKAETKIDNWLYR